MNDEYIDTWTNASVDAAFKAGDTKAAMEFAQALLTKAAEDNITRPEMCCALALVMRGIVLAEPHAALLPYITAKVYERYKAEDEARKKRKPQ
jgi:hypothetical protein